MFSNKLPKEDKYDIIEELTKKAPEFFMKKIYPYLLNNPKRFIIDFEVLDTFDMDRYIINNYCLFEGEEILTYFVGINHFKTTKSVEFIGRIYLTNYRLILSGCIKQTQMIVFDILANLIKASIYARRRVMRDTLS
ncbi:MAG: hypothetical protein ACFE9Z_17175 [Promethearchaeota archaeon]